MTKFKYLIPFIGLFLVLKDFGNPKNEAEMNHALNMVVFSGVSSFLFSQLILNLCKF